MSSKQDTTKSQNEEAKNRLEQVAYERLCSLTGGSVLDALIKLCHYRDEYVSPSVNIAEAMQILEEELRLVGGKFTVVEDGWYCDFSGDRERAGVSKTPSEAICKAAVASRLFIFVMDVFGNEEVVEEDVQELMDDAKKFFGLLGIDPRDYGAI